MNSKRALFMLMINQKKVRDGFKLVDLNTLEKVSIEDCYEIVEKDLELLDIIKFLIKKGDIVVNPDLFVDYPELYEWLDQDEWNINKSNKFNQCYKVIN